MYTVHNVNKKSFLSYNADMPVLISVCLTLSRTPVYIASHETRLVHCAACLYVRAIAGIFTASTLIDGQAELTWVAGWRDGSLSADGHPSKF